MNISRRKFVRGSAVYGTGPLLGGLLHPFLSTALANSPLKIGVVSDIQLYEKNPEYETRFRDVIKFFNGQKLDFILSLGDMIETPMNDLLADRYFAIAAESKARIYNVAGNHDCLMANSPKDQPLAIKWYEKRFGPDYFSFRNGPIGIVSVNTFLAGQRGKGFRTDNWSARRLEYQIEQARKDFKKFKKDGASFLMATAHLAPYIRTPSTPLDYQHMEEPWRSKFLDMLTESKVHVFLGGHTHQNFFNLSYIDKGWTTKFIIQTSTSWTPNTITEKTRGCGIITVQPDTFIYQFYPMWSSQVESFPPIKITS